MRAAARAVAWWVAMRRFILEYPPFMKILFGSTNEGKFREVSRVAAPRGVEFESLVAASQGAGTKVPEVAEGLLSYEGNAARKALSYARWAKRMAIADDTGIEIEALGGLPGVYSHRFGLERVALLLRQGKGSCARFICCMSFAEPSGRVVSVHRELLGHIRAPQPAELPHLRAEPLPYARLFVPQGESESLAALHGRDEFLSHRGAALVTLLDVLGLGPFGGSAGGALHSHS